MTGAAGPGSFTLTASQQLTWTASVKQDGTDTSWLTGLTAGGQTSGSAPSQSTISFNVSAYGGAGSRAATILIAPSGFATISVVVTQQSGTFSFSPASANLPTSAAASGLINISGNLPWTATSSDTSWLTVSKAGGTGNDTITYSASQNSGTTSRTASISFSPTADKFQVTQPAPTGCSGQPALSVNPATVTFSAAGNGQLVTVTSNAPWTASVDPPQSWASLVHPSGTGNVSGGELMNTGATANFGSITRTAPVTFTASGCNLGAQLILTQPAATFNIGPNTARLSLGQTQAFTPYVSGGSCMSCNYTWAVAPGGAGGTIDANGNYTAPSSLPDFSKRDTVIATVTGTSLQATATVSFIPPGAELLSFTPLGGNGVGTVFRARVTNYNPGYELVVLQVGNWVNGCVTDLYMWPSGSLVDVGTDNGQGYVWPGGQPIGSQTVYANSQCTVKLATSSYTWGANEVDFNLDVTFSNQFAGIQPINMQISGDVVTNLAVTTYQVTPVAVSITPATAILSWAGQTQPFSASVANMSNQAVTWSISPNVGTINAAGLYTAPSPISASQTVTVTATSVADSTKSGQATISLIKPVTVSVDPASVILGTGKTQQFTAAVTNTSNTSVTWSLFGTGGDPGTISASGLYTSPASIASQQMVTVVATSVADNTKSASATVTLLPPGSVAVTPATALLYASQTQQFTSTVANTSNTSVTWSISPAVGSVSASGLYTAPSAIAAQQTVTVTATSQADNTKSASATVTLMPPIAVAVTPATEWLYASQTQQFTAAVTNTANTAVTWSLNPNVGTISASGLYTAPAMIAAQQTVTVTATSQADNTKKATSIITLLPPIAVSVAPATALLYASQTQQFTAAVTNTANTAVTWSASPAVGSISTSGLYTAPGTIVSQQTITITATSQADGTKTGTATVTLASAVSVSPTAVTLYASQTQQFTATVMNGGAVIWSPSPNVGSISTSGLYTAPSPITAQQTVTVTATSQADNTKTATATIILMPPVTVSVSPTPVTLYANQTQQFTATVTNTTNTAVTWPISPTVGSISTSGLYTAPTSIATQQTVTVTATSQADNTKTATATITLMPPIAVSVTPTPVTLCANQTQQFAATVTNTSNTAVTWSISPNVGSVSTSGLYTAPTSIATQQTVTVTATSQADNTKTATATITLMPPEAISTPSAPAGSASGTTGTSYTYSTGGATSNLGHQVQYQFSWSDGTNSGWLPVGTTSASHSWSSVGSYTVAAQARCSTDTTVTSTVSNGLTVSVTAPRLPSKVGRFVQPASTGDQAITGLGFQPKVVLFWVTNNTADGSQSNAQLGVGAATGSAQQWYYAGSAVSGGSSFAGTRRYTQSAIGTVAAGSATILSEANLKTLDSDGFTLTWTTADSAPRIINYLALGGLTNAYAGYYTTPPSVGTKSITGLGFRPDAVVILGATGSNGAMPHLQAFHVRYGVGFASSPGTAVSSASYFSGANNVSSSYQRQGKISAEIDPNGTGLYDEAGLQSLDADGFTLNYTTAPGGAAYQFFVALKGAQFYSGSFNQATSNGNQSITGLGFQPSVVLFNSTGRASSTSIASNAKLSFGVAASSTSRFSVFVGGDSGNNPTTASQNIDSTKALKMMSAAGAAPTTQAAFDFVSNDASGFTINNTATDTTSREVIFLAIGSH